MLLCVRSLALLTSAVLIAVLLRPVLSGYYATKPSGNPVSSVLTAITITNEDARYHYLLGLLYQRGADKHSEEAIDSYRRSLERDPTRAFTWLALSKAYAANDNKKWAEYAVRRAVLVDHANPPINWEAGMFYLTEGQLQGAAVYFRRYLVLMPSEQGKLYTILHAAGMRPAFMLDQLLPAEGQFRNLYFRFLLAHKQTESIAELWERRNSWRPATGDYLAYCDFLIETGSVREAQSVWTGLISHVYPARRDQDSSNMIFNGDFEYPPQEGGFDWKIGHVEGVHVFIDSEVKKSGRSSLAARFSGTTNPGMYVAQQTVLVKPRQHYRISAQIRTDHLTTRNGVLLEVLSQDRASLAIRSDVVTGTNDWKPVDLEFTTPAACSLVRIGVKREQSTKFDNKISGDVWLDEFKLTEVRN